MQTGKKPKALANAPVLTRPQYEVYLIYLKISHGKDYISLADINAYCQLYGNILEWWEIEAILGIDKAKAKIWQRASQN